jgi:hypothetical protein
MKVEIVEGPLSKHCLVVFLQPKPKLCIASPWPLSGFHAHGVYYKPMPFGDGVGFYDWLRDSGRNILGVRLWPFDLAYATLAGVKDLNYIEVEPGKNISIHFVPDPQVAPALSCDQDFLYSALFRSEGNDLAVAFGLENLTRQERESFKGLPIEWVSIRAHAS